MSAITTHVLDTSRGRPARGVVIRLEVEGTARSWRQIAKGATDEDGRATNLLPNGFALQAGTYRLIFETGPYFAAQETETFYREVVIVFTVSDPEQHYHVPLLLSPFGYSTYRGS
jgi:5-hydroxyisourate hydrolase